MHLDAPSFFIHLTDRASFQHGRVAARPLFLPRFPSRRIYNTQSPLPRCKWQPRRATTRKSLRAAPLTSFRCFKKRAFRPRFPSGAHLDRAVIGPASSRLMCVLRISVISESAAYKAHASPLRELADSAPSASATFSSIGVTGSAVVQRFTSIYLHED